MMVKDLMEFLEKGSRVEEWLKEKPETLEAPQDVIVGLSRELLGTFSQQDQWQVIQNNQQLNIRATALYGASIG